MIPIRLAGLWMPALALSLTLVAAARADIIWLKSGGRVEGLVADSGDSYEVTTKSGGKVTVAKDQVDRIEKKPFTPDPPKAKPPAVKPDPPEGPAGGDPLGPVYVNSLVGFSIRPPAGWRTAPSPSKGAQVTFLGPMETPGHVKLDVMVVAFEGGIHTLADSWRQALAKAFGGYESEAPAACTLDTIPAFRFSGTFSWDGRPMTNWIHICAGEGKTRFVLNAMAPQMRADEVAHPVELSVQSFRLVAPPQIPEEQREAYELHFNKAYALMGQAKREEAVTEFQEALKAWPDSLEARQNLASLYLDMDQLDRCAAQYEELVHRSPEDARFAYNLGTVRLRQKKYPESIAAFQTALEHDPGSVDIRVNLAVAQTSAGRLDDAVKSLMKAQELDPASAAIPYNLGQVYLLQGRKEQAREAFQRALVLDPNHKGAMSAIEQMRKEK
ncbi:MAG: tetratricopeptide repeat protein [Planctomycetes bacterium]|nr:tetratricopeptide repeat protein [Planctomycetota bacterium]